ncbi:hypothetical protein [Yersinia intermedia]|uniref:hypothetical protein n=1 Tax=Yersinia intermedia TaxID=631 RepID=UPI000B746E2F|nr:hypothetical protein [Yersinia intermedia]MCW8110159.1 hypothetical protein [Yersinia intermedia]MDA5515122.1 hypothetical protein [Yersinia intermedia]OWF90445.1 hypothetical protein B4916_15865 [Yersinia intermedia]
MELREIGKRLYNVLWNANSRNRGQPISVSIDDVMSEINKDVVTVLTREQVVNVIVNDPFRQMDALGVVRNIPMFETTCTNDVLMSVRLPEIPYKHPEQWGL